MSNAENHEWPLSAVQSLCDSAAHAVEELPAFLAAQKAGMKHVPREHFQRELASLKESPFLRVLKLRSTKEAAFLEDVRVAVFQCEPTEFEVNELGSLFAAARQDPRLMPPLLTCMGKYTDVTALQVNFSNLWPTKEGTE